MRKSSILLFFRFFLGFVGDATDGGVYFSITILYATIALYAKRISPILILNDSPAGDISKALFNFLEISFT